ncbi:unnamed protein product [Echinostoma caproni]|uniref:Phage protein n=1 Tax=Echinostoma caproni TaxID=27848 RepID=A0A183A0R2_9TREM|nr:unnamed protein product [Echinostoma caproni]
MLIRLQKYNYELRYEQGKRMFVVDTLSRATLPDTEQEQNLESMIGDDAARAVSHTKCYSIVYLNCSAHDIEDYFERFEIGWLTVTVTRSKPNEEKKSAFFLKAAG